MAGNGMRGSTPLGRKFCENAEALARYALEMPVLPLDKARLTVTGDKAKATPVRLAMGGRKIHGYLKSTNPRDAAKQILIGQLATLLGAPSAPYILIRGDETLADLVSVKEERKSQADMALFSARAFPFFDEHIMDTRPELKRDMASAGTDSASLAALGQFYGWLHDWDGLSHHVVRDRKTKTLCQFDHEMADAKGMDIDGYAYGLIMRGWETRPDVAARVEYVKAAKEMAHRIHGMRRRDFAPLVGGLHAGGLPAPYKLIDGLLKRRALFDQPAVMTPYAEYARFNMGPRTQRFG